MIQLSTTSPRRLLQDPAHSAIEREDTPDGLELSAQACGHLRCFFMSWIFSCTRYYAYMPENMHTYVCCVDVEAVGQDASGTTD